jgi:hypothetical protein
MLTAAIEAIKLTAHRVKISDRQMCVTNLADVTGTGSTNARRTPSEVEMRAP